MSGYSLDNTWDNARRRLALLEGGLDPITQRRLAATGLGPGWHCLEVGGGGGSVARWLAERVGETGRVLATDIEPTLLEQVEFPQLETRRHDILSDPPPPAEFDIVHARWLLHHLPDPVEAMHRMVSAVRPGGWIIIEEPDFFPFRLSKNTTYTAFMEELTRVAVAGSGGDCFWARAMPREAGKLDLAELRAEGDQFFSQGGIGWASFFALTADQVRSQMITPQGGLSEDEFDAGLELLADPGFFELAVSGIAIIGHKRI